MPRAKQVQNVLFIASLPDLRVPVHLGPAIAESTQLAHQQIAIVLVSPWFNGSQPLSRRKPGAVPSGLSHAGNWEIVQKILTFAYVQATAAAHAEGHILLDVDVVLQGTDTAIDSTLLSNAKALMLLEGGLLYLISSICCVFNSPACR
jgi:pantetheine-phosphate adenylyltransferase